MLFGIGILLLPLPIPFDKPHSTILYDRHGRLLGAALAADDQWRFPPADSIPEKFTTALLLYEDEYFYYHPGINPFSLWRAWRQNKRVGKIVSGGSTLSMQTVRMALGNQPRTYRQKVYEMLFTLKLEWLYSKEEILKFYSENAPFGGNIVGLEAASWRYFGIAPGQLSWGEAAALAVLPNQPAGIYPGHQMAAFKRKRDRLLHKIHDHGYLSDSDLELALAEPLPQQLLEFPTLAYHLLHRSMQEGHSGKRVYSTLDASLQQQVKQLTGHHSSIWAANQVHNAAAIVIEVKTGHILAYVGNTFNPGPHGQHVDIITAPRSPGSLLKPLLYAAALDEGLITPRQLLPDIPLFYRGFVPQNFDKKYRGAVAADHALASSLNVPFVHLLIDYGYEKFHHQLKQMGLSSLSEPAGHYGLALILGGMETSLDQLTALYAGTLRAYQRFGQRPLHQGYSRGDYFANSYLRDDKQETDTSLQERGYLRASSIGYMLQGMQQLNRPATEAGWQQFAGSKKIAWKTGTSYGLRDAWAIGLSDDYVVGVWLGNADGEGRPGLTGATAAAPLLFRIFDVLPGQAHFDQPFGTAVAICRQSGMRAGPNCPDVINETLAVHLEGTPQCRYHKLIHLNKEATYQVNSSCYDVSEIKTSTWFVLPPVMAWYYRKYHPEYQDPPPFAPGCRTDEARQHIALIYPRQFTRVYIPVEQDGTPGQVVFEAAHTNPDAVIYWHLDNQYIGQTSGRHQMAIRAGKGLHRLTLLDKQGHELTRTFRVVSE